jgi:hypothetical protein
VYRLSAPTAISPGVGADWTATRWTSVTAFLPSDRLRLDCAYANVGPTIDTRVRFSSKQVLYKANAILLFIVSALVVLAFGSISLLSLYDEVQILKYVFLCPKASTK